MTLDDLRRLADEATPGPWEYQQRPRGNQRPMFEIGTVLRYREAHGYTPIMRRVATWEGEALPFEQNARLIALAPDLARLVAEQHSLLEVLLDHAERIQEHVPKSENWYAVRDGARVALAKLAELETR